MQKIRINFLEVTPNKFSFPVYRKRYVEEDLPDGVYRYNLPERSGQENYKEYSVSLLPREGFDHYNCDSMDNVQLTIKVLYIGLLKKVKEVGIEVSTGKKFYDREIAFTLKAHAKGSEKISLNSYYLKQQKKFGFLIDFYFKSTYQGKLDKEILKLSLALGSDGRSNRNYYSDHFHKINSFINTTLSLISTFDIEGFQVKISSELFNTPSELLEKKIFRFKNDQTDVNQFNGIRKFGPYQDVTNPVKYVFVFEDKYKSFANNLFFSLIGKTSPGTFPGMQQFFNLPFGNEHIHRVPLKSYDVADVNTAINEVIRYKEEHTSHKIVVVFLEPNRFDGVSPTESPYYLLKFHLTKADIPVQVVRDDITNNANSLKWSTSNIGLQIFSKLGGTPWKLKPSQNECLILGIGSSYERQPDKTIKKYFAYSVCLDSAGLYKKLDVLAEEDTKEAYLARLSTSLVELFKTGEYSKYKKCALHISESVTKEAITSIQSALNQINNIEFRVIKVNTHNKFFGYSNHNTYVPYESTYVQLSQDEYLVWFDGLIQGKENIYQKIGNPIHLKFLQTQSNHHNDNLVYLQDAINLSGANWRGFNSRQMPISVYYAKIVADYTAAFSKFEGFDKSHLSNNLPWFL